MKKKLRFLMLTFSILATTFSVTSIFAQNYTYNGTFSNVVYRDWEVVTSYYPYMTAQQARTSYSLRDFNTIAISKTHNDEKRGYSPGPGRSAEAYLNHFWWIGHSHSGMAR